MRPKPTSAFHQCYRLAARWAQRNRVALALVLLAALLLLTGPSQASFTRYVRFRKSRATAMRLLGGARAFIEAAVGAQRFSNKYRVVSTARFGGELYLGALATWVRVPRSVEVGRCRLTPC